MPGNLAPREIVEKGKVDRYNQYLVKNLAAPSTCCNTRPTQRHKMLISDPRAHKICWLSHKKQLITMKYHDIPCLRQGE